MESEAIEFDTSDGVTLHGDIRVPAQPLGAAIVCHPHPQHGGNRFNPVVDALFAALPSAGIAALRFDFRPTFDDGVGEGLDAEAALAQIRYRAPGVPVFATGYSFGAMIALGLDATDLDAKVLVAPPLGQEATTPRPGVSALVFTPRHDQFAPPDTARPIVDNWPDAQFRTIESADHFLAGRSELVADLAAEWLIDRLAVSG